MPPPPSPVSRFFSAEDGLSLHLRDWPSASASAATPVVCLPGLARTAADFDVLAARLQPTRRVVALDYRGRGLSAHDRNWRNYDLRLESADILTVLTAVEISQAIVIGTSRGGLHAMLLAAVRPNLIRAVALNDIGPVLEAKGLARIRGYVGKLPTPSSWTDALDLTKRTMGAQFTGLNDADFMAYARLTFEETGRGFVLRYDPALMNTLRALDLDSPVPTMWPQFEALRDVPVLCLRGQNSDLLSPQTLAEMARRHPHFEAHVVEGQGHAPLLLDAPTIERIAFFVERADAA